ncbi:MAG: hypothetical protein GW789_04965 [Ignavibacteria bacterium]|nr:hypothetical protein [Ignavibacteria bacterium]
MNQEKVNCKSVMHHICESLGEDLQSEKCISIKEHLDNCPDCKSYFRSVEKTIDFYKKYNADMPEGAHVRLMSVLKLESIRK